MAGIAVRLYTARAMLRCFMLTIGLLATGCAQAAWEIRVWHTMQGAAAGQLGELARRFNEAQKRYRVVLAYRPAGLQAAALASPKSGPRPHIIQVGDAGTAEILSHAAAIVPLWQLMAEAGQPFEQ